MANALYIRGLIHTAAVGSATNWMRKFLHRMIYSWFELTSPRSTVYSVLSECLGKKHNKNTSVKGQNQISCLWWTYNQIDCGLKPSYDCQSQNQSKCRYTFQGISALKSRTVLNLTRRALTGQNESAVCDWYMYIHVHAHVIKHYLVEGGQNDSQKPSLDWFWPL